MNFLTLRPICLCSSFVHFKIGREILTRGLSLWWVSCRRHCFREDFSFPGSFCKYVLSIPLVGWCIFPIFSSGSNFPSLQAFWGFNVFTVLLFLLFLCYHIISMAYFQCQIPIPLSWPFLLTVRNKVFSSFSFFPNTYFDINYVNYLIDLFLWFCKFVD